MTLLRNSGSGMPNPNFAAINASGYPVAFDARALDRESLALTSIIQYSSDSGSSAYCILHSPMMPKWRMTRNAVSRSIWYSLLDSVWEGATTIESPVWTPRGSKFSILHTVIQLFEASRTTSYSISFQPFMDFSTRICGLPAKAFFAMVMRWPRSSHKPDPSPPRANADRSITG